MDDHALIGLAISAVLTTHRSLRYVGHATSAAELVRAETKADLVVLDLHLGDGSQPEENVTALHQHGAHVLVLTAGTNAYLLRRVLRAEILGVVPKSAQIPEIVRALELAARGEFVHPRKLTFDDVTPRSHLSPSLTDREREVMVMFASGMGAKSVARRLGISQNTVNDHLRRVRATYRQIGRAASTKVELYQRAQEDGYVPPPGA